MSTRRHFCTLFDSKFLPHGMALCRSLEMHAPDSLLWILCVDDNTYDALLKHGGSNVRLLRLSELETNELLAVKPHRNRGEYCWTLTPHLIEWVFNSDPSAPMVTYVDSDCFFFSSPERLLRPFEESGRDVMITPHFYDPEYDQSETSGIYCVQFIPFRRTERGLEILRWWKQRCLEWCFARTEDGKFGDQKYLDDWPERFAGDVYENRDPALTLAPWNPQEQEKIGAFAFPCLYHFHGVRFVRKRWGLKTRTAKHYRIPRKVRARIYAPYLKLARNWIGELERSGHSGGPWRK